MFFTEDKNRTIFKLALILGLPFLFAGCSSVNAYDMSYITREKMKGNSFAAEKPRYASGESRPMQLGAIRLTDKEGYEGDPGKIFILQRKKGIYMAETRIETDNKGRYFFSLGINPKNKTPAVGFRMEF